MGSAYLRRKRRLKSKQKIDPIEKSNTLFDWVIEKFNDLRNFKKRSDNPKTIT